MQAHTCLPAERQPDYKPRSIADVRVHEARIAHQRPAEKPPRNQIQSDTGRNDDGEKGRPVLHREYSITIQFNANENGNH